MHPLPFRKPHILELDRLIYHPGRRPRHLPRASQPPLQLLLEQSTSADQDEDSPYRTQGNTFSHKQVLFYENTTSVSWQHVPPRHQHCAIVAPKGEVALAVVLFDFSEALHT